MKRLLVVLQLLLLSVLVSAQTRQITGRITDDAGTPLSGASVLPKGMKTGAQTDADGNFKLSVTTTGDITLTISFTGFSSKTITTNGVEPLTIQLTKLTSTLDDVVVVGYSSIRRKDMTGAVSSVNAKQMKDIPIASAAEAIQGRLAGVYATASEGGPGAEVVVKVRGGSSITQDNQPLYIVDGVPVENALQVLSPQDIASIDVLKDASTTAIYGARAANGVMIITTKGGKAGRTTVTYNGAFGFRQLPNTVDVMNPYDFVLWQYERSRGSIADSTSFAQTYGTTWDTLQSYKNTPMINWQEEVFGRKANFQNHNLSLNGGSDKTSFNLSITKNIEEGIQLESGFDRNLVNFKLDHKISDKFKMGMTFRYIDQEIQGSGTTNTGTRATNKLRHSINYRPFELDKPGFGADDFDDAYFLASGGAVNPVLMTEAEYRRQYTKGTYLVGYINYNILKNLTFRSTIGYDNVDIRTNQFYSKITSNARNFGSLPLASISNQLNNTLTNSNTLQYNVNNYKGRHDFSVLLGQELIDQRSQQGMVETRYFPADISPEKALANMGLGSAPTGSQQPLPTSFVAPPARILSFFGRATYAYNDKYLATFNLRADRSSKFSSENGTLVFPSGSLAWRFSREGFMEGADWLTDGQSPVHATLWCYRAICFQPFYCSWFCTICIGKSKFEMGKECNTQHRS
jgi:TonB-dependent starch-binding outer membrane protein SusC